MEKCVRFRQAIDDNTILRRKDAIFMQVTKPRIQTHKYRVL